MRVVLIVRIWWIPDILIILWRYFPCVPAMLLWTLIGSEVLYGIVYQSGGIHAITRSGSTRRKGKWTHAFLRPPMSVICYTFHAHSTYAAIPPRCPLTAPHEHGSQRRARTMIGKGVEDVSYVPVDRPTTCSALHHHGHPWPFPSSPFGVSTRSTPTEQDRNGDLYVPAA